MLTERIVVVITPVADPVTSSVLGFLATAILTVVLADIVFGTVCVFMLLSLRVVVESTLFKRGSQRLREMDKSRSWIQVLRRSLESLHEHVCLHKFIFKRV